jgi:hypothetical protein
MAANMSLNWAYRWMVNRLPAGVILPLATRIDPPYEERTTASPVLEKGEICHPYRNNPCGLGIGDPIRCEVTVRLKAP